ncbi:hypothetical protein DES53_11970 [Roseimicrobium gellanilyticum]|uniref:Uncharacterized protein n=1 Tax=Roseimicrobium gellanilyticum TaxID=748857 RepID=A0A366H3Q9_9BACT|nr:hypothetical protein [Roseimicrobium gellanilyticum]RBP35904.1 hypothetical protein DES53_11970 [Roseimicrobium gellanilyticum]
MSNRNILPALAQLSFVSAVLLLFSSCRTPDPIWNGDGHTMTDLRTLRDRSRASVELDRGVKLYADQITYSDKSRRTGEAQGRVFLDVEPSARYKWMVEHGHAQRASFDRRASELMLAGMPMLERQEMTMIATRDYTTMHLQWFGTVAQVHVKGPTRTDFAKSNPIPPGALSVPGTAPAPITPTGESKK